MIYMELDPKYQDLRVLFEKAISSKKKTDFLDSYIKFFEKLTEFYEWAKKLGIDEEKVFTYFPDVKYMVNTVENKYREIIGE